MGSLNKDHCVWHCVKNCYYFWFEGFSPVVPNQARIMMENLTVAAAEALKKCDGGRSCRGRCLGRVLNPSPVLGVQGCYHWEIFENIAANLCNLVHFGTSGHQKWDGKQKSGTEVTAPFILLPLQQVFHRPQALPVTQQSVLSYSCTVIASPRTSSDDCDLGWTCH